MKISFPLGLLLVLSHLAFAVPASSGSEDRPAKPNVILLLVDDLGWQDVKCYDIDEASPMETPHLDALASKGVMFWQAYSPAPVCAPSRAAILSGYHPARGDMTSVAGGNAPAPHSPHAPTVSPFYSARMPVARHTLAEALKAEGYTTAHSGKWHISKHHYDYPKPYSHGFDYSTHKRGVQTNMVPDRLTGFATTKPGDPFRLDENGFPHDDPQQAALDFLKDQKGEPFFLYYATWLVHAPLVMRSEQLLRKYEKKLGVTLTEEHKTNWKKPGQTNPFYCAMVEQLDYYMGQIFTYLETTDDPRWPGHKLIENTYILFTSDNGGMEGGRNEIYTDNYPLHRGKISLHEGGTRVPLIITGPDIPKNVKTDTLANGLDFYPTILSLIGAEKPADKILDGKDLSTLLKTDPTDPSLVKEADGKVRDSLFWHFPQMENSSSIRIGDYKLIRRYHNNSYTTSLYRLYNSDSGVQKRADIEEKHDLAKEHPELVKRLDAALAKRIEEMGGRLPYGNPTTSRDLPNKEKAPTVTSHQLQGRTATCTYKNNGAAVTKADLIYTPNNGREWQRLPATIQKNNTVTVTLPDEATHYFINLIDENNFIVIHPFIDQPKMKKDKLEIVDVAHKAGFPAPQEGETLDLKARFQELISPSEKKAVILKQDFENGQLAPLQGNGKRISIKTLGDNKEANKALELHEKKPQERTWMPALSTKLTYPQPPTSGKFLISFDFLLDKGQPGQFNASFHEESSPKERKSFGITLAKDGFLSVSGANIAPLTAGSWHHLELTGTIGKESTKRITVSLTNAKGQRWERSIPYDNYHYNYPTNFQLSSLGELGSKISIDNICVTHLKD